MEGAFALKLTSINPEDLIEKSKELILHKAETKKLKCCFQVTQPMAKKILCDTRRLLQVILNLSSNAIKYTYHGSITIEFSQNKKKNLFKITVRDTGIGIVDKDLERINKLFGLLDKKLDSNQTGIGLGLTITKGIINAMNGNLKVTSIVNVGTTCKVKIPINFEQISDTLINDQNKGRDGSLCFFDPENFSKPSDEHYPIITVRKPRVIVIDDEPLIQLALGTLLSKLGCETAKASNGKLGLDMVNKSIIEGKPYDMVFMDANMPVMSGYEATRLMKQNPMMKSPIVCVSAQDSAQHQELCKKVGISDIIDKPCTINKLKE